MKPLSKSNCEACSADARKLSADEIDTLRLEVEGWDLVTEDNIQKLTHTFDTGNYASTLR